MGVGEERSTIGALAEVRALLLDMDGVLVSRGQPIPGAPEALARLRERRIPSRVITNTSLSSRGTLARKLADRGMAIPAEHIVTALSATVDRLRAESPGAAVYLLGSAEATTEFGADFHLLSDADVDAGTRAQVVVIGDSEDRLTYATLDRAFRQIREGAAFVAMHRNPWWLTAAGPTLDSGALVAGLEYATGRRAAVAGKPSATIFRTAFTELATETAGARHGPPLRRREVAMVGDDVATDLAPARRLGLRTVLVLTGKHGRADVEEVAGGRRPGPRPDLVVPSIAEVVAAVGVNDRE